MGKLSFIANLILIIIGSCQEHDNQEYPSKIYFSSDGGCEVVTGQTSFYSIVISDGSDEYSSIEENDTLATSYDWLTVKQAHGSHSLTVTADPSSSNKKRKLKIYGYFCNSYAEIDVLQK